MECPGCKAAVFPGDGFCGACGAKLAGPPGPKNPTLAPDGPCDLYLMAAGLAPDRVADEIVERTPYGIQFACQLVESTPVLVEAGLAVAPATELKAALEAQGASVELRPSAIGGPRQFDPARLTEGLFRTLLRQVLPAAGGASRPNLNGVRLMLEPGNVILAATDGSALIVASQPCASIRTAQSATLPRAFADLLLSRLGEGEAPLAIELGGGEASVSFAGTTLASRHGEGAFPEFRAIIRTTSAHEFAVNRAALLDILDQSSFAFDSKGVWIIEDGVLTIADSGWAGWDFNREPGEYAYRIPADYIGGRAKIVLNGRLLHRVLTNFDCAEVHVGVNDELSPAIFRPLGGTSPSLLLMPIKPQARPSDPS